MANFNESKLSKVLARRVIAPEDRSQLLPLSTPIYCPTHNGVRAARVTIINPQSNSFYTDNSIADTVMIGCQYKKVAAVAPDQITAVGTPNINQNGIYIGDNNNYYQFTVNKGAVLIYKNVTKNQTLFTDTYSGSTTSYTSPYTCNELQITINTNRAVSAKNIDTNQTTNLDVAQNAASSIRLIGAVELDLTQSTVGGKSMLGTPEHLEAVTNPSSVKNTVDIDLNKSINLKYFVPHEVDLETDVDLMDIIKSDFAVKFKHSVSSEILVQLTALVAGNLLPKIEMVSTLSDALGSAIAKIISNGTGQKFSIYKYDNGAPIEYITNSNQPHIDSSLQDKSEFDFTSIDAISVPALYYYEKPTLILDSNKFEDYQQGLCGGTIKEYVRDAINVDTTADSMTNIGEGIFGTNDCFAVAFTEPSIKIANSTDFYGKEVCITVNYGVVLINKTNLTVFT